MRSRTENHLPGRCQRCWVMEQWCICAAIPTIENRTEVLVLRHELELRKSTNTARITQLALARMEIRDWHSRTPPDIDAWLAGRGNVWLLYPGESTADVEHDGPDAVLVLDGTWRQARKMLRAQPKLWRLPRLGLPPADTTLRRLRVAPRANARSTMEAIAAALTLVEGPQVGEPLERLHEVMVQRVFEARGMGDPHAHDRDDEEGPDESPAP